MLEKEIINRFEVAEGRSIYLMSYPSLDEVGVITQEGAVKAHKEKNIPIVEKSFDDLIELMKHEFGVVEWDD